VSHLPQQYDLGTISGICAKGGEITDEEWSYLLKTPSESSSSQTCALRYLIDKYHYARQVQFAEDEKAACAQIRTLLTAYNEHYTGDTPILTRELFFLLATTINSERLAPILHALTAAQQHEMFALDENGRGILTHLRKKETSVSFQLVLQKIRQFIETDPDKARDLVSRLITWPGYGHGNIGRWLEQQLTECSRMLKERIEQHLSHEADTAAAAAVPTSTPIRAAMLQLRLLSRLNLKHRRRDPHRDTAHFIRNCPTADPRQKWELYLDILQSGRPSTATAATPWTVHEVAMHYSPSVLDAALSIVDLLPPEERIPILNATTRAGEPTLFTKAHQNRTRGNYSAIETVLTNHACYLINTDYEAGVALAQQVIPAKIQLYINYSNRFFIDRHLSKLSSTQDYTTEQACQLINQLVYLTSHQGYRMECPFTGGLLAAGDRLLKTEEFSGAEKLALLQQLRQTTVKFSRMGHRSASRMAGLLQRAQWLATVGVIKSNLEQQPIDLTQLTNQLIEVRTVIDGKQISQASLDALIIAAARLVYPNADRDNIRQIFFNVLRFSETASVRDSLACWDGAVTEMDLQNSQASLADTLAAIAPTLTSLYMLTTNPLQSILIKDRPPTEQHALMIEMLYQAYQKKIVIDTNAALTTLLASPHRSTYVIAALVIYSCKQKIKPTFSTLFSPFTKAKKTSLTPQDQADILFTVRLLKRLRVRLTLFTEQFQQICGKTDDAEFIRQLRQLQAIRKEETYAVRALQHLLSQKTPLDQGSQQRIIEILRLIPAKNRNEYLSLHQLLGKTADAHFIFELLKLGIDPKRKNSKRKLPHEACTDPTTSRLLMAAASGDEYQPPAAAVMAVAVEAKAVDPADAEELPQAAVLEAPTAAGGGAAAAPAAAAVAASGDEDPAQLKTEDGERLTPDGQLKRIYTCASGKNGWRDFWRVKLCITFLDAISSLFERGGVDLVRRRAASIRLFFWVQTCRDKPTYRQGEARILREHRLPPARMLAEGNLSILFASRETQPQSQEPPPPFNPAAAGGGGAGAN
jgi:hypothetical protein